MTCFIPLNKLSVQFYKPTHHILQTKVFNSKNRNVELKHENLNLTLCQTQSDVTLQEKKHEY